MNKGRGKRRTNAVGKAAEVAWGVVLERVDSRIVRRARVAIKQAEVGEPTVEDGRIVASVRRRGPDRRFGQVSLPLIDIWTPYHRSVATWFCQRPDWLAALMAGEWHETFLEFVAGTGLQLFPAENRVEPWLAEAACGCDDWESPCRHVVAVIVQLAAKATTAPLETLAYVGLSVEDVLDEVHRLTADKVQDNLIQYPADPQRTNTTADADTSVDGADPSLGSRHSGGASGVAWWPEEQRVLLGHADHSVANPTDSSFKQDSPSMTANTVAMQPRLVECRLTELVARYLPIT